MRVNVAGRICQRSRGDDGCHELTVQFDAPLEEVDVVEKKVREALEQGRLIGPDGRETTELRAMEMQNDTGFRI